VEDSNNAIFELDWY